MSGASDLRRIRIRSTICSISGPASIERKWEQHLQWIRYILFGEWLFARHTIHYRELPHYFFEFDIYVLTKRRRRFFVWQSG